MEDIDALLEAMENVAGTVTDVIIDDNRRRHVSLLLSERGSWRPGTNQIYIDCELGTIHKWRHASRGEGVGDFVTLCMKV